MSDSSNKTSELVREWITHEQYVEKKLEELNTAQSEFRQARINLTRHLVPEDAKVGEIFCIWVNGACVGIPGDVLINVGWVSENEATVTFRQKEKNQ